MVSRHTGHAVTRHTINGNYVDYSDYKLLEEENKQLKGEEPFPDTWWKDCPKAAQKTLERVFKKNADLEKELDDCKE